MTCAMSCVLIKTYYMHIIKLNSYPHSYTYKTCHTKHQSQLLLLYTIVLESYCSFNINFDGYNFSHITTTASSLRLITYTVLTSTTL